MRRQARPTNSTVTDTMSDDSTQSRFLVRIRRAVSSTGRRVEKAPSKLVARVRATINDKLAPAIEAGARELLLELAEPENARRLQRGLAGVAQAAMRAGFGSDPPARLLFDFVDTLEERHTRETILQVVVEHAVNYEGDLIEMLLAAGPGAAASRDMAQLQERAGERLLTLLCSLAALERDQPAPTDREAQILYFEAAPIEERFKPLARMAAGDERAFARHCAAADDDAQSTEQASRLRGLVRRLTDLTMPDSDHRRDAPVGTSGTGEANPSALARFLPSLNDPVLRFLTMSYLFFLQSYLLRAMIEGLPEALQMAAELERARQDDEDVVDIGE